MFCRNCQTIIPDDSIFCENCGAPTGRVPEEIDESQLVPEEAVEFEVDEEPVKASSVPVDPVWWEPPEDQEAQPWEDAEEVSDVVEEAAEEAEDVEEPEEAAEDEIPDEDFESSEDANLPEEPVQGTPEEAAEEAAEEAPAPEASAAEESVEAPEEEPEEVPDDASEEASGDEPEENAADKSGDAEKPGDGERSGAVEKLEEGATEIAEAARDFFKKLRSDKTKEPDGEGDGEGIDFKEIMSDAREQAKPYVKKAKTMLDGLGKSVRTGTGWAADAAKEQLQQMKEEHEERKEQREQQREEDRKRQEEERKKFEIEQQRIEQERKRREEEERQRQQELKEKEERELQEDIIQSPGFWYGAETPEADDAGAPEAADETAAGEGDAGAPEAGSREGEDAPKTAEEEPAAADAAETPAAGPESDGQDSGQEDEELRWNWTEPGAHEPAQEETVSWDWNASPDEVPDEDASETGAGAVIEEEPKSEPEPEADLPAKETIEDKLADTARFDWSRADLENAAAGLANAGEGLTDEVSGLADEVSGLADEIESLRDAAGSSSDEGTTGNPPIVEPNEEEEPSIYRIQDYEPEHTYENQRGPKIQIKAPKMTKKRWTIIAVIVALVIGISALTAYLVHQEKQRQLEEQAYQASVKQAQQLVETKKYKEAEELYLQLMDQRPEDTQNYVSLAQMYMDQQRYIDAKALIKRAVDATGDKETFKQMKKDIKILTSNKWKKEYIEVLEEHESEIRRYEEDVQASVAVCDVNGDLRPELFFFTEEYYGYGKLHIYTIVDKKAKEVSYECRNRGTQYQDAFYDVSSYDASYALFNCKEEGKFAIYANFVHGDDSWDTTNEYKLNLKGGCKRESVIEGAIDTTYTEEESDNSEYLKNEEEISYDKYIEEFRRVLDEVEQVILYNGSGGDQAVWSKVNADSVMCMPYDSIMVDLEAD